MRTALSQPIASNVATTCREFLRRQRNLSASATVPMTTVITTLETIRACPVPKNASNAKVQQSLTTTVRSVRIPTTEFIAGQMKI